MTNEWLEFNEVYKGIIAEIQLLHKGIDALGLIKKQCEDQDLQAPDVIMDAVNLLANEIKSKYEWLGRVAVGRVDQALREIPQAGTPETIGAR